MWSPKVFLCTVKMYTVSSSWTKSLLVYCIWFSTYKQRTKFKTTVKYETFEIHRKDRLRLTFIHWSHVILRNCRADSLHWMYRLNQEDRSKWGRIWTIILPIRKFPYISLIKPVSLFPKNIDIYHQIYVFSCVWILQYLSYKLFL